MKRAGVDAMLGMGESKRRKKGMERPTGEAHPSASEMGGVEQAEENGNGAGPRKQIGPKEVKGF